MKKLLLFFPFLISCSTVDDCVCTQEFRFSTVLVLDNNNQPVDSLVTSVKNLSTGETYTFEDMFLDPGRYIVMTDNYVNSLSQLPSKIEFTGLKDSRTVKEIYQFNTDECNCHINKVSGSDTLRINLN